jgi:hypothetical protein
VFGSSALISDAFVCKLSNSGSFVWARQIGGTNFDNGYTVKYHSTGVLYVAGLFAGTADFDPGTGMLNMTSIASTDMFITKWNDNLPTSINSPDRIQLTVAPNPTTADVQIKLDKTYPLIKAQIINASGQEVSLRNFKNSQSLLIQVPGSAGIYFIKLEIRGLSQTIPVLKH